jgi:hypothetical protein
MKKEETINVPEKKNKKEEYASPIVEAYGTLQELTQMPGGSISVEGHSGKIHKKDVPPGLPHQGR